MMFEELLTLEDIKKEPYVIENIRWDLEPQDLMEPRLRKTETGVERREGRMGYVFYVESMDKEPMLFMLRHTANDFGETAARIDEAPEELVRESVAENKDRHYFGMYPISKGLEAWLKKELGVA